MPAWRSKGLSDESFKTPSTPNKILNLFLYYVGARTIVKFNGSCLKQDKIAYTHIKIVNIVNIYIVYEINKNFPISSYPTLENCLLGAVKLPKHPDIDGYKYSGYCIGFDRKGKFSVGNGFDRNFIIFGVDMSSSIHVDNKKKDILIIGEGITQGLDGATLTTEKMYPVKFTENNKNICLSWHYNGANSYLFVNGKEIIKVKAKDSEIVSNLLCLGNISEKFPIDNMKKAGLNGYNYDFIVDYDAIAVDDILDIHKYLMKKNNIE